MNFLYKMVREIHKICYYWLKIKAEYGYGPDFVPHQRLLRYAYSYAREKSLKGCDFRCGLLYSYLCIRKSEEVSVATHHTHLKQSILQNFNAAQFLYTCLKKNDYCSSPGGTDKFSYSGRVLK